MQRGATKMHTARVRDYMTPAPRTVAHNQTLEDAGNYMRKLHVRQLPVVKGNVLMGVITDQDINLIFRCRDLAALTTPVSQALTPNPYLTSSAACLEDISLDMAGGDYGCVLVLEDQKLVGIFTAHDILRA